MTEPNGLTKEQREDIQCKAAQMRASEEVDVGLIRYLLDRYEAQLVAVEAERDAALAQVKELQKKLAETQWRMAP